MSAQETASAQAGPGQPGLELPWMEGRLMPGDPLGTPHLSFQGLGPPPRSALPGLLLWDFTHVHPVFIMGVRWFQAGALWTSGLSCYDTHS